MCTFGISEEELNYLLLYHYDGELQEDLRQQYASGELSAESNRLTANIEAPPQGAVEDLPFPGSFAQQEAVHAGTEAVVHGKVGLVILNGGMATRFGGAVKGTVPVAGRISFLGLKLIAVRLLAERLEAEIPVYLMNSIATHEATLHHLRDCDHFGYPSDLVVPFLQNTLLRLTPDAKMLRLPDGSLSPYGPGHGDLVEAVARDPLLDMKKRGLEALYMSNVDNALATPDPVMFGMHFLRGAEMTVEVVPNTGNDPGGAPAIVNGKTQIVEAFRLPEGFPTERLPDFNTNTFCFSPAVFDRGYPLSWYVVKKEFRGGTVIQFERLAGQLSEFLATAFIRVDRTGPGSRFCPIKNRLTLQRERNRIVGTLIGRGFLPTDDEDF